jgi:aerobic carbon-monoxide dehydrogenase medium subunit
MKDFQYLHPQSIPELTKLLSKQSGKVHLLAGGTDLLVMMKQGRLAPEYVVSLKDVPGLSYLQERKSGGLSIGAMTPLREIECSPLLQSRSPALSKAAGWIGSPQVRWRATIGGNLCNGAPSADLAPPLICLGAKAWVQGKSKRMIPLEKFFLGPGKVDIGEGEFLRELLIPPSAPRTYGTYQKFSRSAMDIAVVGVAAAATLERSGVCSDLKICLGAVAPTPLRALEAERLGTGRTWNDEIIQAVALKASEEAKPIDDVRGTVFLRRTLVEVLTRRALRECLEQARG